MSSAAPALKTSSTRVAWIELARVLLMYVIICLHLSAWQWMLHHAVSECTKFTFFFISAFFMTRLDAKTIIRRLKKMISLYVVWCFLGYLFMVWRQHATWGDLCSLEGLNRIFGVWGSPYWGVLWFLRDLIILTALAPLLSKFNRFFILFISFLALVAAYITCPICGINIFPHFELFSLSGSVILFMIGLYCQRFVGQQRFLEWMQKQSTKLFLLLCLVLVVVNVIQWLCLGCDYEPQLALLVVAASTPSCLIISAFLMEKVSHWVSWLANLSPSIFFVFVFHSFFTRAVGYFFVYLYGQGLSFYAQMVQLISPPIVLFACIGIYYLLRRNEFARKYLLL